MVVVESESHQLPGQLVAPSEELHIQFQGLWKMGVLELAELCS